MSATHRHAATSWPPQRVVRVLYAADAVLATVLIVYVLWLIGDPASATVVTLLGAVGAVVGVGVLVRQRTSRLPHVRIEDDEFPPLPEHPTWAEGQPLPLSLPREGVPTMSASTATAADQDFAAFLDDQQRPEAVLDDTPSRTRPYVPVEDRRALEASVLDTLDELLGVVIGDVGRATRSELDLLRRLACCREVLGWFRGRLDAEQLCLSVAMDRQRAGEPVL